MFKASKNIVRLTTNLVIIAGILVAQIIVPATAGAAPTIPQRLSYKPDGNSSVGSAQGSLSGNGSVAVFSSYDGTLDSSYSFPTDNESEGQYIYLRYTNGNTNKLISLGFDGSPYNKDMRSYRLSSDGTKLIFITDATNVVSGLSTSGLYLYSLDVTTLSVRLIGLDMEGDPVQTTSFAASQDGSKVVFAGIEGLGGDFVYLRNTLSDTTTLLSPRAGIITGISADGRYFSYQKNVDNVLKRYDIFTGADIPVSINDSGQPVVALGSRNARGISADGNRVVFMTTQEVLTGRTNTCGGRIYNRIYIRDVNLGQTYIGDIQDNGQDYDVECNSRGVDSASGPYIDGTGNRIFFGTTYTSGLQVYVHDFQMATTRIVTNDAQGLYIGVNNIDKADISADGSSIIFSSNTPKLGTNNGSFQVYVVSTNGYVDAIQPTLSFYNSNQSIQLPDGLVVRLLGYTIQGGASDNYSGIKQVKLTAGATVLTSDAGGGLIMNCASPQKLSCDWVADQSRLPVGTNTYVLSVEDLAGSIAILSKQYTVL